MTKRVKKSVFSVLALLVAMSAMWVLVTGCGPVDVNNPPDVHTMLKFTATTDAETLTSGTKYMFWKISNQAYTFKTGDCIEYDVYLENDQAGLGGIEVFTTAATGGWFRDKADWVDENSISGHPNRDLTDFAYGKWYHRKLTVPADAIGSTARDFDIGIELNSVSATYVAYFDNIKITNGGADVQLIYVNGDPTANAYRDGATHFNLDPTLTKVEVVDEGTETPIEPPVETHEALKVEALCNGVAATGGNYRMHIISNVSYTWQAGDKVEYDVFLATNTPGLGGLDIVNSNGTTSNYCFRNLNTGISDPALWPWKDADGNNGHPRTNITSFAYNKSGWYHRVLTVPQSVIDAGYHTSHWDIMIEYKPDLAVVTLPITYTAYFDNICVTRNGEVVQWIYKDGEPASNTASDGSKYDGTNYTYVTTVSKVLESEVPFAPAG